MTLQRFQILPKLLLLLVALRLSLPAFGASEQLTQVAAGDLRLTLRSSASGVRIDRLLDTQSGQNLLATNPLPLFSLTLHAIGSTKQLSLRADDGWRHCTVQPRGSRFEVRWSEPTDKALAGLSVTATVSPEPRDSAVHWKLRIDNTSTNWSVWQVVFPQVALASLGTNAAVLFPRGPGEVQRGIWDRPFSYQGNYPGGWCSMQFMAAYREDAKPTGLYVAMHDPWGSTKDLTVKSNPAARTVQLSFEHPAPNMGLAGNGFALEGEAVWQVLRGDWFDAATIYKAWARREAKWWPRLAREGRADSPRWMRELNAWAMTGGAPNECVPTVKQFREFLGVPAGFHWYNWHQIPFDNDYPHYFPAKEGFSQGVAELKAAGVFPMPYINGRLWDSHDRGAEDFEFSKLALAAATKQEDGSPGLEQYGSKETNGEPVRLGVMCPATPLWQNTVSNIVLRLLSECGTSAVYIDQVAAAPPRLCMDRTHGHPLGGGHWWNEGYWKMLEAIRRQMPRDTALTTECNGEPFIRWFDGYLTWHWQSDGQVPAFPAVYGGAIQMFGRAYRGGKTRDLALRMKAAQQLVFGEQLGWIEPGVVKEKENAEFFRQMVRLRAEFNHYFSAGEMARPPKLLGPVPTVRADWQWSGEWWVTTDAVLTGAWRLPKEKRMVLLFVNVSDESVPVQVRFEAAANGIRASVLRVHRLTTSGSKADWQSFPASFGRSMTMPPREAEAWELEW
ncbi:MAG: DUF6259 domain-containing protein [Limisphaerales bacterium]